MNVTVLKHHVFCSLIVYTEIRVMSCSKHKKDTHTPFQLKRRLIAWMNQAQPTNQATIHPFRSSQGNSYIRLEILQVSVKNHRLCAQLVLHSKNSHFVCI